MNLRLVLAGTHQEFLGWLADGGRSVAEYRPVRSEDDLAALRVNDVFSFDQVGTYWNNRVWGSERYKRFMDEGVAFGMVWASSWEADFTRCQAIQDAWRGIDTWAGTVAEAAERQRQMEELLGG